MFTHTLLTAALLCAAAPAFAKNDPAPAADRAETRAARAECVLQPDRAPPGKSVLLPVVRCTDAPRELADNGTTVPAPAERPVGRD